MSGARSSGEVSDGQSRETQMLFASPEGSWTMVRTDGDIACLVDFGSNTMGSGPQRQARN